MLRCCDGGTALGFGRPGWDSQPGKRYAAHMVQCRAPWGSLRSRLWGAGRDTATAHPSHAACWDTAQREYSTDTCFIWSMRFITFWGQGHACNTLISGAMVQRSIDLGCSGHSWHTSNMYPVSQANWGLQRRLSIIFALCRHSFSPPY